MLNFAFYEDSFRYNPFDATFSQPTLVFQGLHDTSVDPRTVEAFARERPNVTLSLLDDDHQLTASLPRIWDDIAAFLEVDDADERYWPGFSCALWRLFGAVGLAASRSGAATMPAQIECASASRVRAAATPIQTLPLETYVARVLAGEAARDSPPAALEALAITIRTFALANRGRHRADGFDLCDQTHCQVVRTATAATERAAQATAGRVLLRDGAPASVYYSASCGGRTEIPSDVWPGADDPPFLPSKDDDACGGAPAWDGGARRGRSDCARFRAAGFRGDRFRDMRIASRNGSGRVARLSLDGLTPAKFPARTCASSWGARSAGSTSRARRSSCAGRGRLSVQRPRLRARRRPVRHRLDQPGRTREKRRAILGQVFSRPRHRDVVTRAAPARRPRRPRPAPAGVLVSLLSRCRRR